MRPPPRLPKPMPDDKIMVHLQELAAAMDDVTAWIQEAVEKIERAEQESPHD